MIKMTKFYKTNEKGNIEAPASEADLIDVTENEMVALPWEQKEIEMHEATKKAATLASKTIRDSKQGETLNKELNKIFKKWDLTWYHIAAAKKFMNATDKEVKEAFIKLDAMDPKNEILKEVYEEWFLYTEMKQRGLFTTDTQGKPLEDKNGEYIYSI